MKNFFIAATLFFSSSLAIATPLQCSSTSIISVLIYSNGMVNVLHSGRGDYTMICSLKDEYQGVNVATCAMWTSMLLNLKNANKKVDFYYDTQYTSCGSLPTYGSSPAPTYIGPVN